MIRSHSAKQLTIAEFDWPFQVAPDENNRWVKMSQCIPWDELAEGYYQSLSATQGRPAKDARLVIGAVIVKHKLCLSDEETVRQIQDDSMDGGGRAPSGTSAEKPYLQYFVGLPGYQMKAPFAPSLLVEVRKRMGQEVFEIFHGAIIEALESEKAKQSSRKKPETEILSKPTKQNRQSAEDRDDDPPSSTGGISRNEKRAQAKEEAESGTETERQGKLILDATVAEQAIRYPTDLNLLNEAREFSERIIDELYAETGLKRKPRTYRKKARKAYLAIAKQKRPSGKTRRRGIKQQLQYLHRNLGHIEGLLAHWPEGTALPLSRWLLYRYWVIQQVYAQQWTMYRTKSRRCDDRIVSLSQPYVRPIVRGKLNKPVEFGAKLSVSLTQEGIARLDQLRWEAFHEGLDLTAQVEAYCQSYGVYPEVVVGDPLYGTRDNRRYLKRHGIRFAGKPLGRPKKETEENREELKQLKAQRRRDYLERIPIEGKFGQGKNGYGLNRIRAKRADTSVAWINSIFLVMNLMILLRIFTHCKAVMVAIMGAIVRAEQRIICRWQIPLVDTGRSPDILHAFTDAINSYPNREELIAKLVYLYQQTGSDKGKEILLEFNQPEFYAELSVDAENTGLVDQRDQFIDALYTKSPPNEVAKGLEIVASRTNVPTEVWIEKTIRWSDANSANYTLEPFKNILLNGSSNSKSKIIAAVALANAVEITSSIKFLKKVLKEEADPYVRNNIKKLIDALGDEDENL